VNKTNYVISKADRAVCLGSGELKPCPFCGGSAITVGEQNERTKNYVYRVICTGLHDCGATIYCCEKDAEKARATVVENWNKRV